MLTSFLGGLYEVWCTKFSLEPCSGLESFEMHFKFGFSEHSYEFIGALARVMTTLPPTIRKVHFVIDFMHFVRDEFPEAPWSTLGRAFDLKKCTKLQKVKFTLMDSPSIIPVGEQGYVKDTLAAHLSDVAHLLDFDFIE